MPSLTKAQSELVAYLFENRSSRLSARVTEWIGSSPRYARFAEKFKDKIRKKLRVSRDPAADADLLCELLVPFRLLKDPRFEISYEPYASEKTRAPDFSVAFRSNFTFNVEVTHLRKFAATQLGETLLDLRLVDTLCIKLRQLVPGMANLLFVGSSPDVLSVLDLPAHIAWIKGKAERKDRRFYARHRFTGSSEFFKYYERLSGVVLFESADAGRDSLWVNPQARTKLPAQLLNALNSLG